MQFKMPRRRSQLSRQSTTAKRLRVLRSNETADEYMNRLMSQRLITQQKRLRESSAERSQRLAEQSARMSARRARESSAERSQRLAEQRARISARRTRESSAERCQRLAEQRARISARRARESSVERSQRLIQQKARSTVNRARRMNKICNNSRAQKWRTETPGLRCSGGKDEKARREDKELVKLSLKTGTRRPTRKIDIDIETRTKETSEKEIIDKPGRDLRNNLEQSLELEESDRLEEMNAQRRSPRKNLSSTSDEIIATNDQTLDDETNHGNKIYRNSDETGSTFREPESSDEKFSKSSGAKR